MFCRYCYASLDGADDEKCPNCRAPFDPQDPRTCLRRPFPDGWKIGRHLLATTAVGVLVAGIVALHQAVGTSGH